MLVAPKLSGLVDPRAERELVTTFQRLISVINIQAAQINDLTSRLTSSESSISFVQSNFNNGIATPLINNTGDNLATGALERTLIPTDIPDLDAAKITSGTFSLARIPTNVVKTDDNLTEDIVGAPNINTGKVTIKDNAGNSINVMTCA